MTRYLISLFVFIACVSGAYAQVPPEKAEATFKVVDGLEMKLWVSEPLFVNPTCMDIDHKGRVWVCESVNYRTTLLGKKLNRKEGDRIVILEDTKGTGKADKAITFYQSPELLAPLGIAVAAFPSPDRKGGESYKVFVCQSPDILVFTDSKGEGKADGPPKKLLSGFQGIDHDHGVHGILIGPDGKLYFSVGDQGVKNLQSSDGKGRKWTSNETDCRAGTIWRCDMDGKNLELIAHNFRNEYEPCVDSFGTVFVSDNDDDGTEQTRICYVMPGGNYGYHPRGPGQTHWHEEQPGVVPKILRTGFGSPTGMCVYEGTLLPKKYWGQLLHTDAGPRHVRCYHLEPEGAGYKVDREDMVTSTDTWFRPSDICVAPDGSVFVADWYDPGVGGHGMGDTTRGRIYRLAPVGNKPSVPKVDLDSNDGILAALGSPALSVRYMASEKRSQLKPTVARGIINSGIGQRNNPFLRARSFWQLPALGIRSKNLTDQCNALACLHDKDSRFIALGVRIGTAILRGTHFELDLGKTTLDILEESLTNALVRREILLAARKNSPSEARETIVQMAKQYDGKDRFYLEAIGIAVGHHDQKRRDIILADFDKEFPEWNDKVADLVWELRPPSVMPTLGKRLKDAKLSASSRAKIIDILASSDDKSAGQAMLDALQTDLPEEVREKVLSNLNRHLSGKWADLRESKDLDAAIDKLLSKSKDDKPAAALSLISAAGRVDLVPTVEGIGFALAVSDPLRLKAIQTLGELPSAKAVDVLIHMLWGLNMDQFGPSVMQALGKQLENPDKNSPAIKPASEALHSLVLSKDDKKPHAMHEAAVAALTGSRSGTEWLLDDKVKKQIPEQLQSLTGRLLRNSPFVDLRNKAMIAFPPPGRIDPKKLPEIAALAKRKGDLKHGQQLLAASVKSDLQCLKCHTVRGIGGQIGPDLSMIGKKASRENLIESILYPSKAIADQFLTWNIETTKGVQVSGLLIEETKEYILLRDANGKDTKVNIKDIDTRSKSPISIMPSDLLVYMTEDELIDMVEYLMTLKTPILSFDYWHIVGPFDNGDNDAGLDQVFPPEKSIDLKAGYEGKEGAGKISWKTVKPDGHGYFDLAAHYAGHSTNIVSYLYREVESPVDQEATVLVGADDGSKLWFNNKLVFTNRDHNTAVPEAHSVAVKLKKGKNKLLLKINNGNDPHGFYLSVRSEQELKRLDIK